MCGRLWTCVISKRQRLQLLGKEHRQEVEIDAVVFAHDRVRVEGPGDPAERREQVGEAIN